MSRVRPYGDRAVLVETDAGHDAVLALARLVRDELAEAALEVVPGHRTVLVVGRDGPPDRARLAELAERAEDAPPAPEDDAPPVEIAVRYDGADLIGVAELCGVSPEELVRRHIGAALPRRVRRLLPRLRVPRRRRSAARGPAP